MSFSNFFANLISKLLKNKKSIASIISMPVLANKKVSLKNPTFPRLS